MVGTVIVCTAVITVVVDDKKTLRDFNFRLAVSLSGNKPLSAN